VFIFIGGLVWVFMAAREHPLQLKSADARLVTTALGEPSFLQAAGQRSNRLPLILIGTSLVFVLDVWLSIMPLTGALYVAAVVFSLSSTRTWHTIATAVWTLALSFLALLLSFRGEPLWTSLSSHSLIAYFIVGAAAFGLAMQRRIHGESLAWARASQAREESEQLRSALTRAEAADARMRTALDRLTLATHYAGISIWEWDLVADMIYAAEGSDFGQRLGTATHMRGGDFIRNFVYVDDRDGFADVFRKALAEGREGAPLSHRYRSVLADGSVQHIQLRARVYYDGGKPTRIVGVDWNVTREVEAQDELKRQAEQLRDAERRLERASLSNLEGYWETDLLTGQSWISSSFAALMGFKSGEFEALRITALDLAHPDDRARNESAYMEYLRNGTPYDVQLRLRNAQSEYRWYRVQGAAERDAEQRPVRISGAIQDIHLQKLAEDALRDAQGRFVRAVRGAQDGLFDYDLINDAVWFSPRFKRMLGYEENELNVKLADLPTYVHPDDVQRANDIFVRHVRDRVPYDIETRIRKRNGEWLWIRSRAVAEFGRNGRAIRLSGSVQDITEERRAREQLERATAEAEAANLAKSTFLATMSHEIRTPMNGIVGMTELLLDTELDRTQREYASIIRGSADSLLHVINDVLDFSKIEAGKLEIDITDMDLRAGIEDVCALMALQAAAKNVEVVLDIRPEVPEFVRGDAQRIRQCLLNLLSNAVKFTQRGEIVVEVCVLAQQEGRSLVQFQVHDTGIGMQPDQVDAIFKPFVQADSSTTRRFGGTGLGLSIVKKLVELMEGSVGADSQAAAGSTFWFVLPLQPIEATGQFARLNVSGLGRRVLVVDDNEANRNVLGAQLSRAGFVSELAADGAAALHVLRRAVVSGEPFDAALVDFQMPAMDGAMFGEIVNADSKLSNTRLILLSSLDSAGDRSRFSGIGFAAYLAKPVRQRELIRCLQQVLASDAREWHLRSQPMVTRNLLSDAARERRYSGRVLVAEDNDVNRKVAQKYLERLGCSVHAVEDGAQCVAAVREQRFDLVLMDMQMPVMDGVEATREIRSAERGGKRTPIVALTANVLPGQLERCLDAGMDDFLGKPLDVERLRDVLERFGFASSALGATASNTVKAAAAHTDDVLDWARIEAIAPGDQAFANELLNTFIASTRETLRELRAAAGRGDRNAIVRCAHRLKGASGNIGALRMEQRARDLEATALRIAEPELETELDAFDAEARRIHDAVLATATKK
jgi:PAS domain S-box-containing protein